MGGSALQWRTTLLDDLTPSTFVQVELSLRKLGDPGVTIGWELILVESAGALAATDELHAC
ncbi:MAG: hypothetical protein IH968_08395 [Gemmatimonadetes bacterium]|nr:hypothetical protein [Gemmatimonadota bacterium]